MYRHFISGSSLSPSSVEEEKPVRRSINSTTTSWVRVCTLHPARTCCPTPHRCRAVVCVDPSLVRHQNGKETAQVRRLRRQLRAGCILNTMENTSILGRHERMIQFECRSIEVRFYMLFLTFFSVLTPDPKNYFTRWPVPLVV